VHPDVQQKQDGTIDVSTLQGYVPAERHRGLYRERSTPPAERRAARRRCCATSPLEASVRAAQEPVGSRRLLDPLHVGDQEEMPPSARR
jgi:hypothetical protein